MDALYGGVVNSLRLHVLNRDVHLVGGGIRQERFQRAALLVLGDGGVSQRGSRKNSESAILPLDGGSQAAEVFDDELRQEATAAPGPARR